MAAAVAAAVAIDANAILVAVVYIWHTDTAIADICSKSIDIYISVKCYVSVSRTVREKPAIWDKELEWN